MRSVLIASLVLLLVAGACASSSTGEPLLAAPTELATEAPFAPAVAPNKAASTKKPKAPTSLYYKNCTAARAAGAAPLYRGDPGYRDALDRDHDGVACE